MTKDLHVDIQIGLVLTIWKLKLLSYAKSPIGKTPIYVKVGGTRPYFDTALAVKSGADVIVLDGMQGGTAATQDVFIEHVGLPTLACIRPAVKSITRTRHAPKSTIGRFWWDSHWSGCCKSISTWC